VGRPGSRDARLRPVLPGRAGGRGVRRALPRCSCGSCSPGATGSASCSEACPASPAPCSPSGWGPVAARLLARGTVAKASHVRAAGIKLATRGPIDVATARVTFQPGGTTGWHVHPGPALVTVKTGQLTLHRAKGCRSRTFGAGQTFLELGPEDVNLTRNETAAVTETVVTFLLPVGAPVTVDVPAPQLPPVAAPTC
jgi:hypothetical protein